MSCIVDSEPLKDSTVAFLTLNGRFDESGDFGVRDRDGRFDGAGEGRETGSADDRESWAGVGGREKRTDLRKGLVECHRVWLLR